MSGFLQYLHAADPTVTPADGDIPVYSAAGQGYVPTTPSSGGNVTTSATLTAGVTVVGNGGTDIDLSSLTATVVKSTSGTLGAATPGTDYVAPGVTSVQSPSDQRTSNGDFATTYTIAANTATAGMIFDLYLVGSEHVTAGSLFQYSVKFGSTTILPAQGFSAAATNGTWTAKGQFIVLVDGASGKVGGTWGVGQTNGVTGADTTLSRNPWIRPITAEVSVDWTTNQVITVAVTGLAASATSNLTRMVVRSY